MISQTIYTPFKRDDWRPSKPSGHLRLIYSQFMNSMARKELNYARSTQQLLKKQAAVSDRIDYVVLAIFTEGWLELISHPSESKSSIQKMDNAISILNILDRQQDFKHFVHLKEQIIQNDGKVQPDIWI